MPSHLVNRFLGKSARRNAPARALLLAAVCLCLAAALLPRASSGSGGAGANTRAAQSGAGKRAGVEFVPGEVLVQFREATAGGTKAARAQVLRLRDGAAEIEARVERLAGAEAVAGGLHVAHVAPAETLAAVEAFRARSDVLRAEPNFIRRPLRAPNDARYSSQWNMKNTTVAGFDIAAEAAWDTITGDRSIVVGVIDEGIDINHEDLKANVWTNPGETPGNNADDDGNGFVDDVNGWDFRNNDRTVYDGPGTTADGEPVDAHGTHVAGIIGAQGDNGIGVAGVNWQTSLMSLKFIGADGTGRTSDLLRAYAYAKQMRDLWQQTGGARGANLRVLNNSYGGGGYSELELNAVRALADSGILFVAAAGNDASDNDRYPQYPANYDAPNVISVAGTERHQTSYGFTNFGARTVHVYAPGEAVLSTLPGNTYDFYSGTSMASPHVAGIAALALAARPNLSLARLRSSVLYGGEFFSPGFGPTSVTGRRVSAARALENAAEADAVAPAAVGNLRLAAEPSAEDPMARRLAWTAPGDDGASGRASVYEIRYSESSAGLDTPEGFARGLALVAPPASTAGTEETHTVRLPFRHANGFVAVRAIDNVGNAGPVSVLAITNPQDVADPYTVSTGAAEPLSTGGTPLNLRDDDRIVTTNLPFRFTYFNRVSTGVAVSTNGSLMFTYNGPTDLHPAGVVAHLAALPRVAGLWDDLRTDRRAGDDVYVVVPDQDRVIFRWQAVTYDTPTGPSTSRGENPVNFEIELRRDGTIITRYGDGNQNLLPVVGASGGEPDTYLVASHTSEAPSGVLKSLAFAPAVTYTPRRPTPPPRPDLAVGVRTEPESVGTGQLITYVLNVANNSTEEISEQTVATLQLPAGTSFVSCQTSRGTCAGPAAGTDGGAVAAQLGTLLQKYSGNSDATVTISARVNAPAGTTLTATATIAGLRPDSNPANNTATVNTVVTPASTFGGVRALSAGGGGGYNGGHTLALKSDGTVWAWGLNYAGQLGDGTANGTLNAPGLVTAIDGVAAVDAGGSHSLALKSDGTVWAWGNNYYGQCGDRGQFPSTKNRPVQVVGLSGTFTAVAAGAEHSLALKSDGTVWAWGRNTWGEVGDPAPRTEYVAPVQVAGLSNVAAVAAGDSYSLALKSDGSVWAWGLNHAGTLGRPYETTSSATPAPVASLTNVAAVSAGGRHALALKTDGTVWAWGDNSRSQLGPPEASTYVPRAVAGLTGVASMSAGGEHSIALKSDGTVWAWGMNLSGRLGDGTEAARTSPVQVAALAGVSVSSVSAGHSHGGAVLADGSVRMWGANESGQLGDRTYVSRLLPTEVSGPPPVSTPVFTPDGGNFTFAQGVQLYVATPGAIIYYTTNGADPTETDAAVSSGASVFIDRTTTLKARAYKPGWQPSAVKTAQYTFPPATPTPTPGPVAGAVGQPIAVARQVSNGSDIFIMNADGTEAVNLTNLPGDDMQPAWSADGTQIAFQTFRGLGGTGKICVMNADGSELKVLSNTSASDGAPAWSPDGRQIAFSSVAASGSPAFVHVMNADGTGRRPVNLDLQYAGFPQWSPDGSKLVVTVFGGPGEIWTVDLVGGGSRRLTNNGFDDNSPVYSPDGTKIAFASNRDGDLSNYEIYVMNADGTNPVRLTNAPGWDMRPSWSPDGTQIIFDSTRDGSQSPKVYVMNADGSNQRRISPATVSEINPVWRRHQPATVQFAAASYRASEGDREAVVTVSRTDDLSSAISIDYSTADDQAAVRCDDTTTSPGVAFARCDYATTVDTLAFAPGETQKSFTIPLVDDAHVEGDERVRIVLSRPSKAALGARREVVLTIADNDTAAGANPLGGHTFFVRQQYLDFLSREPEASGMEAWLRVLNNCPNVNNDPSCDRNTVSSAFFRSPEFQLKGLFVYKFYRVALARLPLYEEITADMRRVAGQTSEEVQARRDAYTAAWAQRADFRARFDNLTDAAYVDKLLQNVGLQQLTGAVTRDTLITDLVTARRTRAGVLRAVVEHPDVEAREYNGAFVAMQYYGYLRRAPEPSGYQAWLNYLNQNPSDFRTMVNGFVNSQEYRLRFGQP
jgi:uncharacterized repeat protein (TIGR01451 family)